MNCLQITRYLFFYIQVKQKQPRVESPTETDTKISTQEHINAQTNITQQQNTPFVEIESIDEYLSTDGNEVEKRVIVVVLIFRVIR